MYSQSQVIACSVLFMERSQLFRVTMKSGLLLIVLLVAAEVHKRSGHTAAAQFGGQASQLVVTEVQAGSCAV